MFPAETVKAIAALGADSQKLATPRIVTCDKEPAHVYFQIDQAGKLTRTEAAPGPKEYQVSDLDTLARVAIDHSDAAQIWYTRGSVTAVLTDDWYPPTATLDLYASPQFQKLIEWDMRPQGIAVTQKELILSLRTLFNGCVPPDLIATIRKVQTKRAADVNSQVAQGKVSLSKSMIAEMSGSAEIPECVEFDVPIFASGSLPVRHSVRVAIDPDPENERFVLIVLAGDVERAWTHGERMTGVAISEALHANWHSEDDKGDCPIPVYFGQP